MQWKGSGRSRKGSGRSRKGSDRSRKGSDRSRKGRVGLLVGLGLLPAQPQVFDAHRNPAPPESPAERHCFRARKPVNHKESRWVASLNNRERRAFGPLVLPSPPLRRRADQVLEADCTTIRGDSGHDAGGQSTFDAWTVVRSREQVAGPRGRLGFLDQLHKLELHVGRPGETARKGGISCSKSLPFFSKTPTRSAVRVGPRNFCCSCSAS